MGFVGMHPEIHRDPTRETGDSEAAQRALLHANVAAPPAESQLALQARFQARVDGGISKTIHLPPEVTAVRIADLIQRARALGCKGAAFWRASGMPPAACVRCAA